MIPKRKFKLPPTGILTHTHTYSSFQIYLRFTAQNYLKTNVNTPPPRLCSKLDSVCQHETRHKSGNKCYLARFP
jgi:hypothetical protein